MKYIFGLGNPGLKYRKTRHNAGFCVVDILAKRHGVRMKKSAKMEAEVGQGSIGGQRVTLVKPLTYMNNSGYAVSAIVDYYDVDPIDLLVVYDDIDIPFGSLRIREKGSPGTHNGMRSIVFCLQTEEFIRVRVGIGRPAHSLTGHVLGKFDKEDREQAVEMFSRAADACESILSDGVQKAQEKFQKAN
ncbi:aminoacyl-tRNA hydrolase [Christensenellaceae bacterium OttesenSCG-928-K19]|nr:aminoacyl-tRNA hydrolase [Christensenellaceae bacterium OttesenSCG-928-K19]